MTTHILKTIPPYYNHIMEGRKTFDVRIDDREFCEGDKLILQEYDPKLNEYTGQEHEFYVTYVLHGDKFGIEKGYVVMSIESTKTKVIQNTEGSGITNTDIEYTCEFLDSHIRSLMMQKKSASDINLKQFETTIDERIDGVKRVMGLIKALGI